VRVVAASAGVENGSSIGERHGTSVTPLSQRRIITVILDALVDDTAPSWWPGLASAPNAHRHCWSPPATTPNPSQRATFAHLCGASPIDVSSGKHERHRLNRGGDRQANSALWKIVITRMVYDPQTRDYIDRRMKDGLTRTEAIRCLKRYIAREVYNLLPRHELALDSP
jgi:hypothetical protein